MDQVNRGQRSPEAAAYRRLYKTAAWQRRRTAQLTTHPLCARCQARGSIRPATVADHIEPHRGDATSFHQGALQSLCKACHDGAKQSEERRGYSTEIGIDGFPIDPRHPARRG